MSGCLWPKDFPLASISEEQQCISRSNRAQKKDFTILMELSVSRMDSPEVMGNGQGGREQLIGR